MADGNAPGIPSLAGAFVPPPPLALERRTRALASAHLQRRTTRLWSLRFGDCSPSPILVPALLASAAVVFAVDAFVALTHFLAV